MQSNLLRRRLLDKSIEIMKHRMFWLLVLVYPFVYLLMLCY